MSNSISVPPADKPQLFLHPAGAGLCVAQIHIDIDALSKLTTLNDDPTDSPKDSQNDKKPADATHCVSLLSRIFGTSKSSATKSPPNKRGIVDETLVLIVDNSGSMGGYSARLVNTVFPTLVEKLAVDPNQKILLVLFESRTTGFWVRAEDLKSFRLPGQGGTCMAGVWDVMAKELLVNKGKSNDGGDSALRGLRVVAISDGAIGDQAQTMANAMRMAPELQRFFGAGISACAVRLATGGQPDTRALASVLQLNTGDGFKERGNTGVALVDLNARDEAVWSEMGATLAGLLPGEFGTAGAARWRLVMGGSSAQKLLKEPWLPASEQLVLKPGKNVFWVQAEMEVEAAKNMELALVDVGEDRNELPVEVVMKPRLTQTGLGLLLEDKIDHFVSHVKLLKVIDTEAAREQIQKTLEFFRSLEEGCGLGDGVVDRNAVLGGAAGSGGGTLKARAQFLQRNLQSQLRSITTILETIANDDKIRSLNQAQQADYLRQIGTGVAARGLAKRAQKMGLDFDETVRKEVKQMSHHFDDLLAELETLPPALTDDSHANDASVASSQATILAAGAAGAGDGTVPSRKKAPLRFAAPDQKKIFQKGTEDHLISTVSHATTLEGIQTLVEWYRDEHDDFQLQPVGNLLKVFNVVGIPVKAKIGDYPDPMTYRVDEAFVSNSSLMSVADVLMAELLDENGERGLKVAGFFEVQKTGGDESEEDDEDGSGHYQVAKKAVNVIPVFDDIRVQRFLMRYAPNTLELLCGVGMRRVLAVVPKTFSYSVVAGIWCLICDIATNPHSRTTLTVSLLQKMLLCYEDSLKDSQLLSHLLNPESFGHASNKSFFLDHNGMTNLIGPLWTLVRSSSEHSNSQKNIPSILRALFTYETYQATRHYCKCKRASLAEEASPSLNSDLTEHLLDIGNRQTALPRMFERPRGGVPEHDVSLAPNADFLAELKKEFAHIAPLAVVPALFSALRSAADEEQVVAAVRALPTTSFDHPEAICEQLQISYDFDDFFVYNVVEGFLCQSKQSRIDPETNKSIRPDLVDKSAGVENCAEFIRARLQANWEKRLKSTVIGQEQKILKDELVDKLVASNTVEQFEHLLKHGLQRGAVMGSSDSDGSAVEKAEGNEAADEEGAGVGTVPPVVPVPVASYVMECLASSGYALRDRLVAGLVDPDFLGRAAAEKAEDGNAAQTSARAGETVPVRAEKLFVFLTGENWAGEKIWNGGNLYPDRKLKEQIVLAMTDPAKKNLWNHDQVVLDLAAIAGRIDHLFETKPSHIYRPSKLRNRHGHGADFWSYFAFGFPTLEKFVEAVPVDMWNEYKENHWSCCGVAGFVARRELA